MLPYLQLLQLLQINCKVRLEDSHTYIFVILFCNTHNSLNANESYYITMKNKSMKKHKLSCATQSWSCEWNSMLFPVVRLSPMTTKFTRINHSHNMNEVHKKYTLREVTKIYLGIKLQLNCIYYKIWTFVFDILYYIHI